MAFDSLKESVLGLPVVGPLIRAGQRASHDHVKDMGASIAFFSFFSLFPLLVGIVAAAGYFVDPADVQVRLDQLLADKFPGSASFVRDNVEALIELRHAAGVASIVGLLWSANKMSGAVSRGINHALDAKRNVPSILSPLRNFAMTLGISTLLFLSAAVSTFLDLLPRFDLPLVGEVGTHAASYLFVFAMLALLYKLVPYQRPSWKEVLPGALVGALFYELGKSVFALYVENVANLQAVYGSLTSIIVLLLWLYFSALVLLFGAELIAVRREEEKSDAS